MSFSSETLRMNLKSKNLTANGYQDLKTLIGDLGSQSNGGIGGGISSLPKNKARGFAAVYDVTNGVTYGMEQVSATGTVYNEGALRLFTANYTGYMSLGKYTTGNNFVDWITINPSGNVGINNTGPIYKLDVNGDVRVHNITGENGFFQNLTAVNLIYGGGTNFTDLYAVNFTGTNVYVTNLQVTGPAFMSKIYVTNLTGSNGFFNSISGLNSNFVNLDAKSVNIDNLYSDYGIINNLSGDIASFTQYTGDYITVTSGASILNLTGDIANFNTLHSVNNTFDNISNINFTGVSANITNITGTRLNITTVASINNFTGNSANINSLHAINNNFDYIFNTSFTGIVANITNITGTNLNITGTASINNLTGNDANFVNAKVQHVTIENLSINNITGINFVVTNITGTNLNITGTASINNLTGNSANFNSLHAINNNFDYIFNTSFTGVVANITNITGTKLNIIDTATINNTIGNVANITNITGTTLNITGYAFINSLSGVVASVSNITSLLLVADNITGTNLSIDDTANLANITGNNSFFNTITAINTYKPAGSQFWTITSDSRLKTEINKASIKDSIKSIKDISVKTYKYIPEYLNKYNIKSKILKGVIADELELTHPNNVAIEGNEILGDKIITSVKRVDMSEQLYDLIVVCQNLLQRVEELEEKIEWMSQ